MDEVIETPAESAETPIPTEVKEVTPVGVTPELYELPDGRKVDGTTLHKEYTENLLPEFTRRSQELAALKQAPVPQINQPTNQNYWEDPNWQPATIAEFRQSIKDADVYERTIQAQLEAQQREAIQAEVGQQLADIKANDKDLNENELFAHAHKFGFTDLHKAYENYSLIKGVTKSTEQRVAKNMTQRGAPVAGVPTGSASVDLSKFSSPLEALRFLKGSK